MTYISKKEDIMQKIDAAILKIIEGNASESDPTVTYQNTVTYTDRQYINVTEEDILNKKMPWIIINNEGETLKGLPTEHFESTLIVQIVGFVKADDDSQNLDTLMNSLQHDVLVAILTDIELGGKCDYLTPRAIQTVPTMVYPYGGFVITVEIVYTFHSVQM